jgi:4'-phosphopantetheinyl transferase EntD
MTIAQVQDDSIRPADRLTRLFDRPVAAFEVCGPASPAWLHPAEAVHVAQAVEKRRLEFAGGRRCAREALVTLGGPGAALAIGEDRAPAWPAGFVGSITHTRGYCGAVASPTSTFVGIGVDAEMRRRLRRELERRICTDAELRWLDGMDERQRADMATVLFSAKEAFYKCQFCVTRTWLGFHDARLDVGQGTFRVEVRDDRAALAARRLEGRFEISDTHVFTGIGIPSGS